MKLLGPNIGNIQMPLSSAYQEWVTHDFLKFKAILSKEQEDWIQGLQEVQARIEKLIKNNEVSKEFLLNDLKIFSLNHFSENVIDKIKRNLEYLQDPMLLGIQVADEKEFYELINSQIQIEIARLIKVFKDELTIPKINVISFLQECLQNPLGSIIRNESPIFKNFKKKLEESASLIEVSFFSELIQHQIEQLAAYHDFLTEYQVDQIFSVLNDRLSIKILDVQKNKLLAQPDKSLSVYPYPWLKECHDQLIARGNREELLGFDLILNELTQTPTPISEMMSSPSVYFIDEEESTDENALIDEQGLQMNPESHLELDVVYEENEDEETPRVVYRYPAAFSSRLNDEDYSETESRLEAAVEMISNEQSTNEEDINLDEYSEHQSIEGGESQFEGSFENLLITENFTPGATIFSTNSMFIRQTLEVIYRQLQENQEDLKEMVTSVIFKQASLRGEKIWAEMALMSPPDRRYWNRWILRGYQDDAEIVMDLLMSKHLHHLLSMTLKARPYYLSTKFTSGRITNLNLLHRAISSHFNLDLIQSLVRLGVSAFDTDLDNRLPLLMFLELANHEFLSNNQYVNILKEMMRQGSVNFLLNNKDFFLRRIIENNISELIKSIGISYNWKERLDSGLTPLIFALELRKPEAALELIKLNAFEDQDLSYIINSLIALNYDDLLFAVIDQTNMAILKEIYIDGLNLLHFAMVHSNLNLIKACLQKGFSSFEKTKTENPKDCYDLINEIQDIELKSKINYMLSAHSSLVIFSPEYALRQIFSLVGRVKMKSN